MSFTYDNVECSGYSTGTTGIELFKSFTLFVTGLKYDGTGIDITEYRNFTGYGIIGSGTIATEISGRLNYDVESQYWRTDISIPSGAGAGATATGIFTFEYNTGDIAGSTGWATTSHIRIFGSKALDAWNMLTLEDGVRVSADLLHGHASAAQFLYDLDDVFVPGSVDDGNALIYFAASGGWTTGIGSPDDWAAVSGEVAEITGTLPGHIADGNAHHRPTAILDSPVDGKTTTGISANWAYDHKEDDNIHHAVFEPGDEDGAILTHKNIATAHHTATVAGDLDHQSLANRGAGDHHTATVAGDLLHNSLDGLNAGVDYEHITQDQKNALHEIQSAYDFEHNSLNGLNDGTDYEHITQDQKNTLHAEAHDHDDDYYLKEDTYSQAGTQTQITAFINAALIDGESIDAAIDDLILTHKNNANDHHVAFVEGDANGLYSVLAHIHDGRYYREEETYSQGGAQTMVGALIAASLVNGQPIDSAIDALIGDHAGLPDVHHVAFVQGDADILYSAGGHRHDADYYTEGELNAGQLDNRYYTETELDAGQLDNRYYRENETYNQAGVQTQITAFIGAALIDGQSIDAAIDDLILTHKNDDNAHHEVVIPGDLHAEAHDNDEHSTNYEVAGTTHDDRYYTETELNNGQLDNRYYRESETYTQAGAQTMVTSYIAASLVNGQPIDNRIDTLIGNTDHINAAGARTALGSVIDSAGHLDKDLDADGHGLVDCDRIDFRASYVSAIKLSISVSDHVYHGTTMAIVTNGGAFGVPMYMDTTAQRVSVCVDTSINTMPCIGLYVAANLILTDGYIRHNAWAFAYNTAAKRVIYVNASVCSTTIPPSVNDIVQIIGVPISADEMFFKPSLDYVKRK